LRQVLERHRDRHGPTRQHLVGDAELDADRARTDVDRQPGDADGAGRRPGIAVFEGAVVGEDGVDAGAPLRGHRHIHGGAFRRHMDEARRQHTVVGDDQQPFAGAGRADR
jgi:hypothetical protein